MDSNLRVIHDSPLDGPANMAFDEALLTAVGAGASPPTLRLYQWSPPTISLGYFQRYADYAALPRPAGALPVVRRLTGGGAILHDLEVTYSLAIPAAHRLAAGGAERLYELVHDALLDCLTRRGVPARRCGVTDDSGAARGPFFCFARRHALDVVLGDGKLAGSAQRRTRGAVLQHGSIMLGTRFSQQPVASLPDLGAEELGRELAEAIVGRGGWSLEPGEWSVAERALVAELVGKYAGAAWSRLR